MSAFELIHVRKTVPDEKSIDWINDIGGFVICFSVNSKDPAGRSW